MKKIQMFLVFALLFSLSSCQLVAGIFKAGVGVGVLAVVAIVALVIFIFAKVAGGGK
jgi:hypothetical protein